jgi:hypothetical protein
MSDISPIPPSLSFASAANNPNMATTSSVKPATPEIIIEDEAVSIELMTDLIFENIGGQELINIARTDIVNGQNVIYQPIKNLTSLYFQYNPQNILALQNTSEEYFKKFPIKLSSKIPTCGNGPDCRFVYIDQTTGDLIIELINMEDEEQVEVQLLSNGQSFNDTIYVVNE